MVDKKAPPPAPPMIITLTLPADESEACALLIQRGELAHVRLFFRGNGLDIQTLMNDAAESLDAVEAAPPVIPAPPEPPKPAPAQPASTYVPPKPKPEEPMLTVPYGFNKTTKMPNEMRIPVRFIQLPDMRQQSEVLPILSKLIEGKLWDGKSAIRIDDVAGVANRLKHLTAKDLILFNLADFAQVGDFIPPPAAPDPEPVIDAEEIEEEEADELEEVEE